MHRFLIPALMSLFFLTACSWLDPIPMKPMHHYQLSAESHFRTQQRSDLTLMVNTSADPSYETQDMMYQAKPYQLEHFSHNQWVTPPKDRLLTTLVESLIKTHYFKAVITQSIVAETDYRLSLRLHRLEQNFIPQPSEVILECLVVITHSKLRTIVASQLFTVRQPTTMNNPESGVVAANQALAHLLEQVTRFTVQSLAQQTHITPLKREHK